MRISRILPNTTDEELALALRNAFADEDGRIALTWILRECFFFDKTESPEEVAMRNFGIDLLETMGVYHLPNETGVIEALREQPLVVEEEKNGKHERT